VLETTELFERACSQETGLEIDALGRGRSEICIFLPFDLERIRRDL